MRTITWSEKHPWQLLEAKGGRISGIWMVGKSDAKQRKVCDDLGMQFFPDLAFSR